MPLPADEGAAIAAKKRKSTPPSIQELSRSVKLTHTPAALKHEKLYLDHLPAADRYNRSLMHRDTLAHVAVTR